MAHWDSVNTASDSRYAEVAPAAPTTQIDGALRGLESALNFLEGVAPELVGRIETVLSPETPSKEDATGTGHTCSLAALIAQQARRVSRVAEYLNSVKNRVEL